MKILVLGAGAIGSVFAGFLAKNGHEVILFGRDYCIDPINSKGLFIEGLWGSHHITNLKAYSQLNKIISTEGKKFDLTLLTVKSYHTKEMINGYLHTFRNTCLTISLQNGLGNLEAISQILGKKKAMAGRVIFGAEQTAPAKVKVTVYADKVVLGAFKDGVPYAKVKEIAEIFDRSGIPTTSTEEIEKFIWDKVLYNGALNALSCLLEVHYGKLLENQQAKTIMYDTIWELFKLIKQKRVMVDWKGAEEYSDVLFKRLIPVTYDHYSSMLQDKRRGKETEIDALNGKVVSMAEEIGIDLPLNRVLTALVKAKK